MARWLEQVRHQIPKPPGEEPTKPTKAPSVGFVGPLGGIFQKTQTPSETDAKPASAVAGDLETRIRFAHSEAELDQVVEQIQAEFEAGHLSQVQAERLAGLTLDTARQLARGLVNVPASACLGEVIGDG